MADVPRTVVAMQGDTVDIICRREYGAEAWYTERVLAANRGLSALPTPLPLGTVVKLPEIERPSETTTPGLVTLWD